MPKVTRPVKTCCICIETIKPEKEARITSCRHRYCKKCIRKWSKVNNRCPQCKRRFNWIIDVKRKKKEPVVVKKDNKKKMIEFMVHLVRNFLYNSEFRLHMRSAILRANEIACTLFEFLYHIVIDFNVKIVVNNTPEVLQAFQWLHSTKRISAQ